MTFLTVVPLVSVRKEFRPEVRFAPVDLSLLSSLRAPPFCEVTLPSDAIVPGSHHSPKPHFFLEDT
jgi:hypothetical protein